MAKLKNVKKNIAIVLGSKGVNATGLIRSLGEAGFFVIFASTYSKIESKWLGFYLRLPEKEKKQLQCLTNFIKNLPSKPAIFPVDDNYNYFLDDNYKVFEEVAFCPNAKGRLRQISDKNEMAKIALASGLTVPAFNKVNLQVTKSCPISLPVIVKPYAGYAGSKGDINICKDEKQFQVSKETLISKGYQEVLVQHLLCKKDQFEIGLMGISFPNGEVVIPGTIKKIRSYPKDRGSTSYAQIKNGLIGVDEEKLKDFVRKTGYVGIFDIEMIVANGVANFIEINYRNGQYGYSITKAGYNLPENWYNGLTGKSIKVPQKLQEIFYINERDDYRHVKEKEISKKEWKKQFKNAKAYGMYCKGDQRPYVRQYVKIPDRIKIFFSKIKKRIKNLLVKEEWTIAIRKKGQRLIYEDKNTENFKVIKNSLRFWCADPFIITVGEKDYLFFEMYDRFKAKGVIGCREIINGKIGKMKKVLETKTHLSFPFVFNKDGKFYMMPESSEEGNLCVYNANNFPFNWEKKIELLNEKVCDSVLLSAGDKLYLFTMPLKGKTAVLECFVYDNGAFNRINKNPVVVGDNNARLAGKIFKKNDEFIRVAQDCEFGYGLALHFNKISLIDGNYSETHICSIDLNDFDKKTLNKYRGIHTYNYSDNYEVIDLKNKDKFRFGNFINILYRIFKRKK